MSLWWCSPTTLRVGEDTLHFYTKTFYSRQVSWHDCRKWSVYFCIYAKVVDSKPSTLWRLDSCMGWFVCCTCMHWSLARQSGVAIVWMTCWERASPDCKAACLSLTSRYVWGSEHFDQTTSHVISLPFLVIIPQAAYIPRCPQCCISPFIFRALAGVKLCQGSLKRLSLNSREPAGTQDESEIYPSSVAMVQFHILSRSVPDTTVYRKELKCTLSTALTKILASM